MGYGGWRVDKVGNFVLRGRRFYLLFFGEDIDFLRGFVVCFGLYSINDVNAESIIVIVKICWIFNVS